MVHKTVIFFLLLATVVALLPTARAADDDDKATLLEIAPILNGKHLPLSSCFATWNNSTSLSDFDHVTVVSTGGQQNSSSSSSQLRVTKLLLGGCNLGGTLPASMNRLQQLFEVALWGNSLTGALPKEWSSMSQLKYLHLEKNKFSSSLPPEWANMTQMSDFEIWDAGLVGSLPPEWSSMTQLRNLYLNGNSFTGSLPPAWSSMTQLRNLYLYGNSFTGTVPPAWSSMTELRTLSLSGNSFTGSLPPAWSSMTQLRNLYLYGNSFTGSLPPAWSAMTELRTLQISFNRLTGPLPSSWSHMSKLETLYLGKNTFSGKLPPEWANMTQMSDFEIWDAGLVGSLPPEWCAMTQLSTLYLYGNSFTGSLPPAWSSMTQLRNLYLYGNSFTGSLPPAWSSMTQLRNLYLYGNSFTGSLPPAWSSMTQLRNLYLYGNSFTGSLPEEWKSMSRLQQLWLKQNSVSGTLPSSWSSMVAMESFDVSENSIEGPLPKQWTSWENLTTFKVSYNRLTGSVPEEYSSSFPRLLWFVVESNQLSGTLPKCTAWKALRYFYADDNLFSGPIPWNDTSVLPALIVLRLANNKLQGPLPVHLGGTGANLQLIDLHSNEIDSELPASWGSSLVPSLHWLNVADNFLHGYVPPSFCQLSELDALDLSQNCLSVAPETMDCLSQMSSHQTSSWALTIVDLTPKCLDMKPIRTNAQLGSPYKYQAVNFWRNDTSKCTEWIFGFFVSNCVVNKAYAQITQVAYGTFQLQLSCGGGPTKISTSCMSMLFRPIVQCFVDAAATLPCNSTTFDTWRNRYIASWNNKTVLADLSQGYDTFSAAANAQFLFGAFFRIRFDIGVNFAAEYSLSAGGPPGPPFLLMDASSPVFISRPCFEKTNIAINLTVNCVPCPALARCNGSVFAAVGSIAPAYRPAQALLPFIECPLRATQGCQRNANSSTYADGSSCSSPSYDGWLCSRCASNFAMTSDNECVPCPSRAAQWSFFASGVVVVILLAVVLVMLSLELEKKSNGGDGDGEANMAAAAAAAFAITTAEEDVGLPAALNDDEEEGICLSSRVRRWFRRNKVRLTEIGQKVMVVIRQLINHFSLVGALTHTSAASVVEKTLQRLLSAQEGANTFAFGSYAASLSCVHPGWSRSVLHFVAILVVFGVVFILVSLFFFVKTRRAAAAGTVALFLSFLAYAPLTQYSTKLLSLCTTFNFYEASAYLQHQNNILVQYQQQQQHQGSSTTSSSSSSTFAGGDGANQQLGKGLPPVAVSFQLLSADLAQECSEAFLSTFRVGAAIAVGLFSVGLPALTCLLYRWLTQARRFELRDEVFFFLIEDYRREAWYFEPLVINGRKLAIALVLGIFSGDSQSALQLQLYSLVCAAVLAIAVGVQPLQTNSSNLIDQLSIASALVCAAMMSGVLAFPVEFRFHVVATVIVFLTQLIVVGAAIAVVLIDLNICTCFCSSLSVDNKVDDAAAAGEQQQHFLSAPMLSGDLVDDDNASELRTATSEGRTILLEREVQQLRDEIEATQANSRQQSLKIVEKDARIVEMEAQCARMRSECSDLKDRVAKLEKRLEERQ